jgi:LPXTG-motif cell wall-anchored protein
VKHFLAVAAGLAASWLVLLAGAPAAVADPVDDAVEELRSATVYVAPGVDSPGIDEAAVRAAIGDRPIKIAVLPGEGYGSNPKAYAAALSIGQTLSPEAPLTVGVVAGRSFSAASSALCQGAASNAAKSAVDANRPDLQQRNDVTSALRDFVGLVAAAPAANSPSCRQSSAAGQTDVSGDTGGGSTWPWVLGIGAVGAAGAGAFVVSRRRRRLKELEGRRAEVLSLYDRLGADVQNLNPGNDPVARQAMVDASERYTATGSQLSHADTHEEYDVARRAALEGLQAARTARLELGLDPGPDLPPISSPQGEQLTEPRQVSVGGQDYQGYPRYTPGAPHYYGGGAGIPGGWYSVPFWQTLLLGSVLTGGFGGFGGGGYDSGYDRGYEAGREDAGDSGSGWAGGGGGFGGGGGGFGGGDWGGGGGSFGGGGDWGGGGRGGGGGGNSGGGSW